MQHFGGDRDGLPARESRIKTAFVVTLSVIDGFSKEKYLRNLLESNFVKDFTLSQCNIVHQRV